MESTKRHRGSTLLIRTLHAFIGVYGAIKIPRNGHYGKEGYQFSRIHGAFYMV
jgi:hypothetical protein